MPPKKKPQKPDRAPNLLHGGNKSHTCPRCDASRSKKGTGTGGKLLHSIPEVADSAQLRNVLVAIDRNLRQDRDLVGNTKASFMMGVLEAKVAGREYFLVASSGWDRDRETAWIQDKHLGGISYRKGRWETVTPKVPATHTGWWTIRGEKVDLDSKVANVQMACAAVKLLLGLGEKTKDREWKAVEYLRMSEMVFVGPDTNDPKMRKWHGQGATSSWTAHSCDACQARIPYLICDVPANQIS
ncbi:hypothetical protein [Streptomyces decoyicus]|uniref:hypothetical protein n=1 Tax=Streptomyces decoyicus TaxID=249567 RepID=UPI0036652697